MLIAANASRLRCPFIRYPYFICFDLISADICANFLFFFPPPFFLTLLFLPLYLALQNCSNAWNPIRRSSSRLRVIYVIDCCSYRETHRRRFCSISREISRRCRDRRSSRCKRGRIPSYSPNAAAWAADNRRDRPRPRRRNWCTWKRRPRNCKNANARRQAFILQIQTGGSRTKDIHNAECGKKN